MNDNNERRLNVLRRTAKEVRNYKVSMKILKTAAILLLLFLSVLFIAAALYERTGSFTVNLNKEQMNRYGLSLSESRDMRYMTSHLDADILEEITNISGDSLPDNLDMIDGTHNGDNYIAYTFYLQNTGDLDVSYEYTLAVSNITNSLDEAIRIRLYENGTPVTYAKTASDGSGPEPGTTEFYSATAAVRKRVDNFQPGDITRYTVVIWLEGDDPDCIDWLIGGKIRMEMIMDVVH